MQQIKRNFILSFTVSIAILTIAFLTRATDPTHADSDIHSTDNALLTSNRNTLAFCVEVAETLNTVSPKELVREVTHLLDNELRSHPRWSEQGYDQFPIKVEVGCPTVAYLSQPGAVHPLLTADIEKLVAAPNMSVETPSPYRIHIYVLHEDLVSNAFSGTDMRSAPQEMLCEKNECFEVTSSLYLTPEESLDSQVLKNRIQRILALDLTDVQGEIDQTGE